MRRGLCVSLCFLIMSGPQFALAQQTEGTTLEQRQPLELVFADSIVPQDRHEAMLTTGLQYWRRGRLHDLLLTQKVEWGISERLQVSTFANPLRNSNAIGSTATGAGDFEMGARYTWVNVGSPFTHVAVAFDAGFPSGDPRKAMGDGAYRMSPSVLLSHEFREGRYQAFSTTGFDFVVAHRQLQPEGDTPRHEYFAKSGLAVRFRQGWAVGELSVNTNRLAGGADTQLVVSAAYVWRFARRTELLVGLPVGLTSSTNQIGGIVKFTFELGGDER